ERAVGRRHAVSDLTRRLQRRFAGFARQVKQISKGDAYHVVGFVVAPRTGLTEGCDRRVNQTAMLSAQCFVTDFQLVHSSRLGGFEDDVGFAGELKKDRAAVGFFNVESDAALVGVEMKKIKTLFRMRNVVFERRDAPRLVA